MKIFVGLVILVVIGTEAAKEKAIKVKDKDMMRKMVIYDKKTPNMFYCPVPNKQLKSYSIDKMIVKAHPLSKLCEYEGGEKPKNSKSDCYQDVDEAEFACKEKYRIMLRRFPEEKQVISGSRLKKFMDYDKEVITKMMKNYTHQTPNKH